jgi:hypothetical protein
MTVTATAKRLSETATLSRMKRIAVGGVVAAALMAMVLPAGATAPRGSIGKPYPMRTTAQLPGSGGWNLRVNKSIPNATLAVLGNGTWAVRPDKQFFLINVTVGYSGKAPRAVFSAYNLFAVGRGGLAYTQVNDNCGVVRHGLDDFKRVPSGSRISGNLCFWVQETDARVLLLKYQSSSSRRDRAFFKLR